MIVCSRTVQEDGKYKIDVGQLEGFLYQTRRSDYPNTYVEFNRVEHHKPKTYLMDEDFYVLFCGMCERATRNITITPFVTHELDSFNLTRYLKSFCSNMIDPIGHVVVRDPIPLYNLDKQMQEKLGKRFEIYWSSIIAKAHSRLECWRRVDTKNDFKFAYNLRVTDLWASQLNQDIQSWASDIFQRMIVVTKLIQSPLYPFIKDSVSSVYKCFCPHPELLNDLIDISFRNAHLQDQEPDENGVRLLKKAAASLMVSKTNWKGMPAAKMILHRVLKAFPGHNPDFIWMDFPISDAKKVIQIVRMTGQYDDIMDACSKLILLAS
jgi:hypothetical protein